MYHLVLVIGEDIFIYTIVMSFFLHRIDLYYASILVVDEYISWLGALLL